VFLNLFSKSSFLFILKIKLDFSTHLFFNIYFLAIYSQEKIDLLAVNNVVSQKKNPKKKIKMLKFSQK
jgi:hypothetical protein